MELRNKILMIGFLFLCQFMTIPANAERIDGVIYSSGDVNELKAKGVELKVNVLNRNDGTEQYVGNLSVELRITHDIPFPVDEIRLDLNIRHSSGTSFPLRRDDLKTVITKYDFAISACDINRAELLVLFNFPETVESGKYFYAIPLRPFIDTFSKNDAGIETLMENSEALCNEHGLQI